MELPSMEKQCPGRAIILWTDSTNILMWLQSEFCHFKVFVGTRVANIQELTDLCAWCYVDSARNPVYDIMRGKTLKYLAESCSTDGAKDHPSSFKVQMSGQLSQTFILRRTHQTSGSPPTMMSMQLLVPNTQM